jgi:hypothetical protein
MSNEGENVLDDEYETGAMYKFDGLGFVKLEIDRTVIKVPITAEADAALKEIRKTVAKQMQTRPDLSIVASAVIIAAAGDPDVVNIVKQYGAKLYGS